MKKCTECGQTAHTPAECRNGRVGTIMLFGVLIDPKIDSKTYESRRRGKEHDHNHDQNHNQNQNHNQIVNSIPSKSMEVINVSSSVDSDHLSNEQHPDQRKKGVPWTEDEHKSFLLGLEEFGKGNWRAISKNYVPSKTPTQVASHAQKYFIRVNTNTTTHDKGKRRSSLFDISFNEPSTAAVAPPSTSTQPLIPRTRFTYSVPDYSYMQKGYENRKEDVATFFPQMSLMKQDRINFSKADGAEVSRPDPLHLRLCL